MRVRILIVAVIALVAGVVAPSRASAGPDVTDYLASQGVADLSGTMADVSPAEADALRAALGPAPAGAEVFMHVVDGVPTAVQFVREADSFAIKAAALDGAVPAVVDVMSAADGADGTATTARTRSSAANVSVDRNVPATAAADNSICNIGGCGYVVDGIRAGQDATCDPTAGPLVALCFYLTYWGYGLYNDCLKAEGACNGNFVAATEGPECQVFAVDIGVTAPDPTYCRLEAFVNLPQGTTAEVGYTLWFEKDALRYSPYHSQNGWWLMPVGAIEPPPPGVSYGAQRYLANVHGTPDRFVACTTAVSWSFFVFRSDGANSSILVQNPRAGYPTNGVRKWVAPELYCAQ